MVLGLNPTQKAAYLRTLFTSHDFDVTLDLLKLDHTPIRSLTDTTLDGQVNLQTDAAVARTASFTFFDPDHSLHLDPDSPWEGAYYADRMIRVVHTVNVPSVGRVSATAFVGPVTKVARDGDTVNVECQDKASLALTGGPPITCAKGMNAVAAISTIMGRGAGENKMRLPAGTPWRLPKAFATGWPDESAPWWIAQAIARTINRQLLYSSDGYLTLRPWPSVAELSITEAQITSAPNVDYDLTSIKNMVRVAGTIAPPPPPKKKKKKKSDKDKIIPTTQVTAVAVAASTHPMSPQRLGRNGVPRYIPEIDEGTEYKSLAAARSYAVTRLDQLLPMTTGVTFDMVPVFHLDYGDVISAQTDAGRVVIRFTEGSIPLACSGDMSVGQQKAVSRAHRTLLTSKTKKVYSKEQKKELRKRRRERRKKHHKGGHHG